MVEPTIVCPSCKSEVKLTESLAAPLIDSIRQQYEQRLAPFLRLSIGLGIIDRSGGEQGRLQHQGQSQS